MAEKSPSGPRTAALVGPYLSGKTSLLESLLYASGTLHRKGSVRDKNTIGDDNPESRDREMTTAMNVASGSYLGESWTFLDCPGSIELAQDTLGALMVADAAVVVCEPDPAKATIVAPLLKFLDDHEIPHFIFLNKMDHPDASVKTMMGALQDVSARPLVLREIPIRDGNAITGHVDLASERAFEWKDGAPSTPSVLIQIPDAEKGREKTARVELLETLADFDDTLLTEILEDVVPSTDEVYANLVRDFQQDKIVPVFFGSAEQGFGVHRLLKALRHEVSGATETGARLGLEPNGKPTARVFKTLNAEHVGKLSLVRIWDGTIKDGSLIGDHRVSGLFRLMGSKVEKAARAGPGDVVALGKLEEVQTGQLLSDAPDIKMGIWPNPLKPVYSLSVSAARTGDDVKLSAALQKLTEEDPSFTFEHNQETGELLVSGQGEVHLLVMLERLKRQFGLDLAQRRPQVPYRETLRSSVNQHARHKKQSGGHGEFGDVHLTIKPLPRGSGFDFSDSIKGGTVPKQYIPAVKHGVEEALARGPLAGFPVVDVAVELTDGQFHSVDSSEMAFKKAAAQAMRNAMVDAKPILLEPICRVTISIPAEHASKIQRLVSGRRGQIMSFESKADWQGWDEVQVQLPQSEMHDLIVELRSMTAGAGTFEWTFDHLQEFSGKQAEQVIGTKGVR